jgi:hypothetical protein
MTDYKQLCAELVDDLEMADWPWKLKESFRADIQRTRAALAEPEPEGPTTQELKTFACKWWNKFGFVKDKATCRWVLDEIDPDHFADFARDVLARWGNHLGTPDSSTPQPVPVSERLPGPEDCDAWERNHPVSNMWCWWWDSNEDVWVRDEADTLRPSYLTHWLPAHALPLPS